jgi:hypothetical protein
MNRRFCGNCQHFNEHGCKLFPKDFVEKESYIIPECLYFRDKAIPPRVNISAEQAQDIATRFNTEIRFGNGQEHGLAFPCGCVEYQTILRDGSIGHGGWLESCCIDHIE